MRPVTLVTPKPLVPFFGAPLLDHAAAHLAAVGVTRIAVNCHHLGDRVARHVEDVLAVRYPGVSWHLSHEVELLGTGGALAKLAPWFDDAPLWVVNADAVFAADLRLMAESQVASGADATWMVTRAAHARDLRYVQCAPSGRLTSVRTSPARDGLTFCGVHLTGSTLLGRLPDGVSCVVKHGYVPWIDQGGHVQAWETDTFWADTGTPERYLDAHLRGFAHMERWRALGVFQDRQRVT